MAAAQFDGEAQFVSHPAGKLVKREMARIFGEKAAVAEAELFSRLTNNGVPLDSTAARRILQLAPTNPLRPLGPVPASVVRPEDEPAPGGELSPMPNATDNPRIPTQAQGNPPLTAARIPVPDREPGDEPPPESAPTP